MSTMIGYKSPQQTCYAIQRVIESQFPKLSARPYNHREPETTLWWLVPSTEWPAYKYGKMYFNWVDEDRNSLWVGFHTEKGLDASVAAAYSTSKSLRHVMREDWHWFDFVRRVTNGDFPNAVQTVASETGLPLHVRFTANYVDRPADFNPYDDLLKRDEYLFKWNPQSSELDLVLAKPDAGLLGQLEQVRTFNDLAHQLNVLTSSGWVWVNVTFVVPFVIDNSSGGNDIWRALELWANYLRRFRHFWF